MKSIIILEQLTLNIPKKLNIYNQINYKIIYKNDNFSSLG